MALRKQNIKIKKNTLAVMTERGVILLFFTLVWLILSIIYLRSTSGITVLIHNHSKENISSGDRSELLKGEMIKGEFQAKEDNMGIVAVRFNTFFRINGDSVTFRIREKGEKNWYYKHSYLVDQFQPNQLFTFGFPIIPDSDGRTYLFEIESNKGKPEDAVALSFIEPVIVSKYQYSRLRILDDNAYLSNFLYKKTINSVTDINFLISSLVYTLPLMLYVIKLFFFDKYLRDKYLLSFLPILFIIVLCFVNLPRNDDAIIGVIGLWIILNSTYSLDRIISFKIALIFILMSPLLLYLNQRELSGSMTMWGFMLLVAGVIMLIAEVKFGSKEKKKLSSSTFKL